MNIPKKVAKNKLSKNLTKKHICAKIFCYEYIFRDLIISILLDFQPVDKTNFYEVCENVIISENLFNEVPNPYDIMRYCMDIFVEEYECFR